MIKIIATEPQSLAEKAGIRPDDALVAINGHQIADLLDYRFHLTERKVTLSLIRNTEPLEVTITKDEYDDIGLEFATFLMDDERKCANRCIFCFVDQNPPNVRSTLHFKDDDWRLSFLIGNYVTCTNMSARDIERIVSMKISPLNISVHTMNSTLRTEMLGNRNAGKIGEILQTFADAGITMNCQIVLCRGVNDGSELDYTMQQLELLSPHVESVSVVPAGVTKHRDGLPPLTEFTPDECRAIIRQVNDFGEVCLDKHGSRIFFCADEFFVRAGQTLPEDEYFEHFPQLENGVGGMTLFRQQVEDALASVDVSKLHKPCKKSIATGVAAQDFMRSMVDLVWELWYNKDDVVPPQKPMVYAIENHFFGTSVTVAGLVSGGDIIAQLAGKDLGEQLLIPRTMLRHDGDKFLDDVTLEQVEEALGVPVVPVEIDGADFVGALVG